MSSALNPKATGRGGAIFLCLFALPFAGFGTFATIKGLTGLIGGHGEKNIGVLAVVGVVFSIIGYGLIASTVVMYRSMKRDAALHAAHPGEPWLWRTDWADGRIHSNTRTVMWLAWVLAFIWNAVSSGVYFQLTSANIRRQPAVLFVLLFPLVGIGLLVWAIRETIEWKKFGDSTFKLLSVPGVVGGRLGGAIETSVKIKPEDGFHLKLVCVHRLRSGSGKNASVSENIVWQEEKTMARELLDDDPRRSGIPVSFQIPRDAEESDDSNPNRRIIWQLQARAKVPGVNYAATFEVPVFRTPESAPVSATEPDPAQAYEAPEKPFELPAQSRIKIRPLPDGGAEFYFPAARNILTTLYITLFWLIWTGFTLAAYLAFKSLFFEIVFTLVDGLIGFGCLSLWLKSSRVTITPEKIRVTNHWLFMGPTRVFDTREVAGFETKAGMRSGQKQFFSLVLRTNDGKKATVAGFVPDPREANWLAAEMERRLGAGQRRAVA
jgi:hypothetical protein